MLMVKSGLAYRAVCASARCCRSRSGEYATIKFAAAAGALNEPR
jgi:hypothetical protein